MGIDMTPLKIYGSPRSYLLGLLKSFWIFGFFAFIILFSSSAYFSIFVTLAIPIVIITVGLIYAIFTIKLRLNDYLLLNVDGISYSVLGEVGGIKLTEIVSWEIACDKTKIEFHNSEGVICQLLVIPFDGEDVKRFLSELDQRLSEIRCKA